MVWRTTRRSADICYRLVTAACARGYTTDQPFHHRQHNHFPTPTCALPCSIAVAVRPLTARTHHAPSHSAPPHTSTRPDPTLSLSPTNSVLTMPPKDDEAPPPPWRKLFHEQEVRAWVSTQSSDTAPCHAILSVVAASNAHRASRIPLYYHPPPHHKHRRQRRKSGGASRSNNSNNNNSNSLPAAMKSSS